MKQTRLDSSCHDITESHNASTQKADAQANQYNWQAGVQQQQPIQDQCDSEMLLPDIYHPNALATAPPSTTDKASISTALNKIGNILLSYGPSILFLQSNIGDMTIQSRICCAQQASTMQVSLMVRCRRLTVAYYFAI